MKLLGFMFPVVIILIAITLVILGCFFRERYKSTGDKKHCKRAFICVLPVFLLILYLLSLLISKLC